MRPASTVVNVAARARIGGVGVRVISNGCSTPVVPETAGTVAPVNVSVGPSSVSVASLQPPAGNACFTSQVRCVHSQASSV